MWSEEIYSLYMHSTRRPLTDLHSHDRRHDLEFFARLHVLFFSLADDLRRSRSRALLRIHELTIFIEKTSGHDRFSSFSSGRKSIRPGVRLP